MAFGNNNLEIEGKKIQLAAVVNGTFAANCEIRVRDKKQTHVGEIGISVALPYRQEGIGYQLFIYTHRGREKAGLKLLILHCFENNDRALHLYEKLGFKRAGLSRAYMHIKEPLSAKLRYTYRYDPDAA